MENIEWKQIQIEGLENYLVSNKGELYKKITPSSLRGCLLYTSPSPRDCT